MSTPPSPPRPRYYRSLTDYQSTSATSADPFDDDHPHRNHHHHHSQLDGTPELLVPAGFTLTPAEAAATGSSTRARRSQLLPRSKSYMGNHPLAPDTNKLTSAWKASSNYFQHSIRTPRRRSLAKMTPPLAPGRSEPESQRPSFEDLNDVQRTGFFGSRHTSMYGTIDSQSLYTGGLQAQAMETEKDERRFYDDFTTIDWVRDAINDSSRRSFLQSLPGFRGRLVRTLDGVQGWVLTMLVAFSFAVLAYALNEFETLFFDLKLGICATNPFLRLSACCTKDPCDAWRSWSDMLAPASGSLPYGLEMVRLDFAVYFVMTVLFAFVATVLTIRTKTSSYIPGQPPADVKDLDEEDEATTTAKAESDNLLVHQSDRKPRVIYSAYGSGVAEVKTILSGFVIRRYLGSYTLFHKSVALVFSLASGMSLGKEGPFVHLATCVGNISCRLFPKFADNDLKRRQVLSAASSAGVALAFGSPLGGVLFSLEEVSYYFLPQHQLFRIFFCAMMSALCLKFLDPYKTGKIVLFEVSYTSDWHAWELIVFVVLGVAGGIHGALFCKFTGWWAKFFRESRLFKGRPKTEVIFIAVVTACLTFSNQYTRSPISELLLNLTSPCHSLHSVHAPESPLCPSKPELIPGVIWPLAYALAIKVMLTAVTFGIKVPAGIYVPSMVIGALFGRITGMLLQYTAHTTPVFDWLGITAANPHLVASIVPGVYAMAGAGAFMAGITRMNVTLAVILFELTGSLNHVLPFSVTILVANWVANAIEPKSLYELIIEKNDFPYLDNRLMVSFDSSLADLVTPAQPAAMLDLSHGPHVSVSRLDAILQRLHARGEIDGCVPLVKGSVLVGMIAAPQLEFALDTVRTQFMAAAAAAGETTGEDGGRFERSLGNVLCRLSVRDADVSRYHHYYAGSHLAASDSEGTDTDDELAYDLGASTPTERAERASFLHFTLDHDNLDLAALEPYTDLTPYIDRAPLALDVHSPLALVQMMFSKLGPRAICVTKDGEFMGILHKKKFIEYCHSKEKKQR